MITDATTKVRCGTSRILRRSHLASILYCRYTSLRLVAVTITIFWDTLAYTVRVLSTKEMLSLVNHYVVPDKAAELTESENTDHDFPSASSHSCGESNSEIGPNLNFRNTFLQVIIPSHTSKMYNSSRHFVKVILVCTRWYKEVRVK